MAWNDFAALLIVLALFGAVGWSMWAMWRPERDSEIAPDSELDSEPTPEYVASREEERWKNN